MTPNPIKQLPSNTHPSTAKQSLINRTGLTLGAVMLLAIINMLASFLIAESAKNDAVRINLAGSLRMQSYRIAEALLMQSDKRPSANHVNRLQARIKEFEQRLYRPVLSGHIHHASYPELAATLDQVENSWQTLKAALNKQQTASRDVSASTLLTQIDDFVVLIDQLVGKLELQTENKFKLLRLLQGVSLLVTIVIVVLGYVDINSNVVAPLRRLLLMANKMQAGNFSGRLKVTGNDELSLLSNTFNDMAKNLGAMYHDLEQKVQEKTLHLEQARDGITLLYETSRLLSAEGSAIERIERSLANINQHFPNTLAVVDLTRDGKKAFRLVAPNSHNLERNQYNQHKYHFKIDQQKHTYGELIISPQAPLRGQHRNLLQAIADNIAATLSAEGLQDQQHRLVLMEERAVIARELHDSLAQSLSYLKIQISRMQMLKAKNDNSQELENTVQLIKTGIDAAYGQLRELLTTFRLQLSNEGLQGALDETVTEFSQRADIPITLDYQLINFPLTPNEEIHILQIVRESLSNVARHSGASSAAITVNADQHRHVEVCISDNGSGFTQASTDTNHYGKVIIQERAQTLGGHVIFSNQPQGGALVRLSFTPDVAKNHHSLTGKNF